MLIADLPDILAMWWAYSPISLGLFITCVATPALVLIVWIGIGLEKLYRWIKRRGNNGD